MEILQKNDDPGFIRKFLSRYTYAQKLNVVAIIVGSVTSLILYLFISMQLEEIEFANLEIQGNKYQQTIHNIINDVTSHEVLANRYQQGDQSVRSELIELQNSANEAFNQLLLINKDLEEKFQTTPEDFDLREQQNIDPQEIYANWKNLTGELNRQNAEVGNSMHRAIINTLQSLLLDISDKSNMTYDFEVETHYLMESAIRSLPQEQELITTLLISSENILQKGIITQEDKFRLSSTASFLLSSVDVTEQAIQKSIIEDTKINKRLETKRNLSDPLNSYKASVIDFANFIRENLLAPKNDDVLESSLIEELNFLGKTALTQNNKLSNVLTEQIDRLLNWRVSDIKMKSGLIIGFSILAFGLATIISALIIFETNNFFREVYSAVTSFASGDLTARAPPAYDKAFEELRIVLNDLGDSIESIVEQLHKSGVQLTTTTTQIAAAAKHQEGTVCQQEATVKQILVTAGEISETARNFANTMNEVSRSAEETSDLAASGKEGVTQMEDSMHQMVKASKNIASKLAVLNEKASAITSVITTITKVADQTNLLSLNASIEAEKAGEHGKSFAVIAREIRRLADQTASATLDIEKMITEMMSALSEGVMGVDQFSIEIRTGAEHVSTVSEQLTQIIERVQQQTISYESVNKGVQAQSLGAEQINESIMQLSDAAQETTTSIRQFHTAIEQLNLATKEMQVSVARLKK